MARVFLDTNCFIDSVHRRPEKEILEPLENNIVFISPLSTHIYCYTFKIKTPNSKVLAQREKFQIAEFSEEVLDMALQGPTGDFEDNVQLHSAAAAECDVFLTNDKKLLNMKFFGKTKIIQEIIS